jgi:hypothetical protein
MFPTGQHHWAKWIAPQGQYFEDDPTITLVECLYLLPTPSLT